MNRINIGDKVDITFHNGALFDLKVDYVPTSDGDIWILIGEYGHIYYVKNYEYIVKQNEVES